MVAVKTTIGLIAFLAGSLAAQPAASVRDGIYTQDQAGRGKALYGMQCASCHGDTLDGSGQAPPLRTADFLGNWEGQTVDDLFEKIQTTMPADKPGQLSRAQNADILAFVLASNTFPAGEKDLPSDATALKKIRFQAPQAK